MGIKIDNEERINFILKERNKGRSFYEIGKDLGITHERVRQIYLYALSRGNGKDMPTRAKNVLARMNKGEIPSRDELKEKLNDEKFRKILMLQRGFGKTTLDALTEWVEGGETNG